MIDDDELRPLDAPGSDTPDALLRALHALGRERPSAAALQAAAARLQARIDAPLGGEVAHDVANDVVRQAAGAKLLASKWLMAALVVAAGVATVAWRANTPALPPASQVAPRVQQAAPLAASVPAPRQHVAPPPQASAPAASHVPAAPALSSVPLKSEPHLKSRPARPVASKPSSMPAPSAPPAPQAVPSAHTQPASAAPVPTTRASEPTQPSELDLMLQARRLAQIDPAGALPLLAEHARRFPHGALAPEREVLAIDALRALGKEQLADERLRRFRAAYPHSVHTPALDRAAK